MKAIETQRLILRPWSMDDAGGLYAYARDPQVGPNAGWKPHESLEESEKILAMFIREGNVWAAQRKSDGALLGSFGLHRDDKRVGVPGVLMLGYCLGREYWGRGYATEAATALVRYAFSGLGAALVSVYHYVGNDRSRRVIEKCGFAFEGVMRGASVIYDGSVKDEACYSITAEEFFALHGR